MIKVTVPDMIFNDVVDIEGISWSIDNGMLNIYDDTSKLVATFSTGVWISVTKNKVDDDEIPS